MPFPLFLKASYVQKNIHLYNTAITSFENVWNGTIDFDLWINTITTSEMKVQFERLDSTNIISYVTVRYIITDLNPNTTFMGQNIITGK